MVGDQLALMFFNELARRFAGMVTGPILDQNDRHSEVSKQMFEKDLVAITVEPFLQTLVDQLATKELIRWSRSHCRER